MIDDTIALSEFVARRARVLRALRGCVGVVFAGEGSPPLVGHWHANSNFVYLTGIRREPGAAVLFDPANPDPKRRCILLLRPRDPEMETWDGLREPIDQRLRAATGFETVMRTSSLPAMLTRAARRSKRLACLHAVGTYNADIPQDLALFRKISERMPGVSIEDRTELLSEMRAVKSRGEIAQMRRAIAATDAAFAEVLAMLRPGINERDVHATLDRVFRAHGASGSAYNPIVGAGLNSTVLHYNANDRVIEEGDLVCIDAGAMVAGYAADVTRTYPATGKFTKRQREVYEVVLAALAAGIRAARAGVHFHEIDRAARDVIERAGFADAFMHGIGHHLGMEVHDASPERPIEAGAVITIEPGIYLRDEKIGVRIEDDVLITAKGATVLTRAIAKDPDEIEAIMRSARRSRG